MSPQGWQLRRLPVCASTELELARWLASRDLAGLPLAEGSRGLAVIARRQRHGQGQQGRIWHSAPGGLWLSAALPWPWAAAGNASALGLAVAVTLAESLAGLGVAVRLKWPNDLLVGGRKLAGILPRLRWRGAQVRWAQVGLGLNGINRVPVGAISLAEALGCKPFHPWATPARLLDPVLEAVARAPALCLAPELLLARADALLYRPAAGIEHAGCHWQVIGLAPSGGLILESAGGRTTLQGRFPGQLPDGAEPLAGPTVGF